MLLQESVHFIVRHGVSYILGMPTNFKITKVNQLHISGAKIGRNLCLDNIVETWNTHPTNFKVNKITFKAANDFSSDKS